MNAVELINIIRPKHNRDDCNDIDLSNGFFSRENGQYKCSRCALLQLIQFDKCKLNRITKIIEECIL